MRTKNVHQPSRAVQRTTAFIISPALAGLIVAMTASGCDHRSATAPVPVSEAPALRSVASPPPPLVVKDPSRVGPSQPENVVFVSTAPAAGVDDSATGGSP